MLETLKVATSNLKILILGLKNILSLTAVSEAIFMKKKFRINCNKLADTTTVCSELVRRAGVVSATFSVLTASATAFALDCTPNADGSFSAGNGGISCNNINADTVTQSGNEKFYIETKNGLREDLKVGHTTLNATVSGNYTALGNNNATGFNNASIKAENLDFTINGSGTISALSAYSNVNITAKDVKLDLKNNFLISYNNNNSYASYGLMTGSGAGTGRLDNGSFNGKYSTIEVENLIINQATRAPRMGARPVLNNGIRAIQGASPQVLLGNGSAGEVIVNGDLNMTLTGNQSIGIYVSGNFTNHGDARDAGPNGQKTPVVRLKGANNNITIKKGTDRQILKLDSYGIKLGKTRNIGQGAGILESYGALNIDTTDALFGSGIKMVRNSLLLANYENSTTKINTNGYALEIGTHDDITRNFKFEQSASREVKAFFKDAIFTTAGTSSDPNVPGAIERKDLIFVDQGQVGAVIGFSGDRTNLTANNDGYIINVSGNYSANSYQFVTYDEYGNELGHDAYKGSSVNFNASDKGSMTGLVYKGEVKTGEGQIKDENIKPTLDLNLANGFTWNLKKKGSENVAKFDTLKLSNSAVINAAFDDVGDNDFVLEGNVISQGGIINLYNSSNNKYHDILTIAGDYTVSGNAIIRMNTLWNNPGSADGANSESDKLKITGAANGVTQIIPLNVNGSENIIDGDIQQVNSVINTVPVVSVGTRSDRNAFIGTAQTNSATEVQLAKRSSADGDEYFWTMEAIKTDEKEKPGGGKEKPIYANAVAAYIAMPYINQQQAFISIGTLHERRGKNINSSRYGCRTCVENKKGFSNGTTWGRVFGEHLKQDGKNRLNSDTDVAGIQIGHDFLTMTTDNGGRNQTGLYVAYSKANTDFSDKYRAVNGAVSGDKYTGKGKSDAISIGLTNTYFTNNNVYVDLVGQASYLHNKYEARDGSNPDSQNGWNLAFSAETGRPFTFSKSASGNWIIEPQAQLIYQYLNLNNFNDKYRHVEQNGQDALRGRIGVELAHNRESKNSQISTFYAVGNIWHDFINPSNVSIGKDRLREKYAQTWGEIGGGLRIAVGKNSSIYGEARYEHDFGSTKREGYRGNLSFEHKWK